MLEFLQTGQALYVLAAICGLGIVTRWLTRSLYKRLIKETDHMPLTRNRNLRLFKQKTENAYQMNQGIPKIKPFLERQMYDFKCLGLTFHGWNMFSNQMTLLCFLAGGAAAFGAYWYRTDPYYIVLYGSVGILAGLFTSFVDHGAGVVEKRQQLFVALDNYLENTLIYRLDQEKEETQAIPGPHLETRENIRAIYPGVLHGAAETAEETEKQERGLDKQKSRAERMKNQLKAETQARRQKEGQSAGSRQGKRMETGGREHVPEGGRLRAADGAGTTEGLAGTGAMEAFGEGLTGAGRPEAAGEGIGGALRPEVSGEGTGTGGMEAYQRGKTGLQEHGSGPGGGYAMHDADYLKRSLEQIAASREKGKGMRIGEDWLKDLKPSELKLIGEILQEYLT